VSPIVAAQQSLSRHPIKLPLDEQVHSDPERHKDIVRVARRPPRKQVSLG